MAKDWSAEETARIISEVKHPTCSNQELAKQLGRSAQSIAAKKRHLAGQLDSEQPAAEKKAGHSRGRRGGRRSAQPQKPQQEAAAEVQEQAAPAEKNDAPEQPAAEQKPAERRTRGRRGGRKSAQTAKHAPESVQETKPEAASEGLPDAELAALAELDKRFVIRDLTRPAAEFAAQETPAEKAEQPAERRTRGRRGGRKAQNRQPVQEPVTEVQEIPTEMEEITVPAETPEMPAVHIWTREEDSMLLIAPLRSEEDLAAELHCTREEIHARREQLKKQRMEEKERRQRDFRSRRAEAQKRRRVPLERCTTELRAEADAAEEWEDAAETETVFVTEPEDDDKRIAAIRAAVSMLRSSKEATEVGAVGGFLAVMDYILGSGI